MTLHNELQTISHNYLSDQEENYPAFVFGLRIYLFESTSEGEDSHEEAYGHHQDMAGKLSNYLLILNVAV